jgi:phage shock protein PspC (stress-responsive transcriptional regulator)
MAKAKKIKIFFIVLTAFMPTIMLAFYILSLFYYKASENSISGLKSTVKGLPA